jgi:hypothetical protein
MMNGSLSPVGSADDDAQHLLHLINGYRITQAIYDVAILGIPDRIGDGALSSRELADATHSNADALHRVLRALAAAKVLHQDQHGRFSLTATGMVLRSDVPGSRSAWAKFVARPAMWGAWAHLLHTVQTGENAFRHLHGKDTWQFRADNAEESAIFDAAMRETSARSIVDLLANYDFNQFTHIVDVGGGDGTLLAGILARCPNAKGTLLDLPHVVTSAEAIFADARVASRAVAIAGSFFESIPSGADAYLLKHIVHDWQDVDALAILRACRRAATPGAKVLLVERVLGAANTDVDTALSDLNMLVNAGGRERTRDQFHDLLKAAGFLLESTIPLPASHFIIEAACA